MCTRALLALGLLAFTNLYGADPEITIYKTRTCGCCSKWVDHLKANAFTPIVKEVPSTAEYRKQYGVPDQLASCHTARVGDYTIEGHVPAGDIQRLLKSRPKAQGLAVPAMPMGSPGMEGPRRDTYSVLLFDADGKTSEFQKYPGN